jgi:hypothetical protein
LHDKPIGYGASGAYASGPVKEKEAMRHIIICGLPEFTIFFHIIS